MNKQTTNTSAPAAHLRVTDDEDDDNEQIPMSVGVDDETYRMNQQRAAMFSVARHVAAGKQPLYVVSIQETPDRNAVDPVTVTNGDYMKRLRRGRFVIVPECIVTSLNDARSDQYGPNLDSNGVARGVTLIKRNVMSYPFEAHPYKGDLPIGTEVMQDMGQWVRIKQDIAA